VFYKVDMGFKETRGFTIAQILVGINMREGLALKMVL
jgi:hypothetical protein